jgi:dihydrofolate reductase
MHDTLTAGASPDGLIGEDGGLEIKCPELAAHLNHLQISAEPPEYTWQIQGGMWVTGRRWWDFVSYNPDFPEHLQLIVRRIQRNEDAIKKLAAEVEKFLGEVDAEVERIRNLKLAA